LKVIQHFDHMKSLNRFILSEIGNLDENKSLY